ncbi:HEXXH motif domain-containing protein [Micromonospora sp. WMMD1082]|uniref:HEXXH motif domain-containing protein n=1 Tax=Micromonospora sp. WMMD1082 TaxID=3016104 RepID=UPI002416D6C8|nr:HEXXH motif domain-containing protein [Micromonospora sp. WMMD1082]MDG4797555.1 HEXXH motif domain-containing protein [Micromonospora sp. WMMD1082]
MPRAVLDELAAGRGGAEAVARLRAAQHSKTLLLVRALLVLLRETAHPDRTAVEAAYRVLAEVPPQDRVAALAHPPVAAWAFGTVSLLDAGDASAVYPGLLAAVAATAAVHAGADADLDVPLAPGAAGRLELPGLGTVTLPVTAVRARIRTAGGHARVFAAGEQVDIDAGRSTDRRWLPLSRLDIAHGGLPLSLLLDTRTWRYVPGLDGNRRFGDGSTDAWRSHLDGAWRILVEHHRPVAEEISAVLRALVPIPAPRRSIRSGTFHHAFGSVAMSLPPDARSTAAALAHEIQHAKLAALTDLFAVLEPGSPEPGSTELFYAPWRTDPRPLDGLLHGAYAHLGVAGFWRRQSRVTEPGPARHHAEVRFARWSRAAAHTVRVLAAQRRLTPIGRHLVDGMAGVLARWLAEPVPARATAEARRLLAAHRARWDGRRAPTG